MASLHFLQYLWYVAKTRGHSLYYVQPSSFQSRHCTTIQCCNSRIGRIRRMMFIKHIISGALLIC